MLSTYFLKQHDKEIKYSSSQLHSLYKWVFLELSKDETFWSKKTLQLIKSFPFLMEKRVRDTLFLRICEWKEPYILTGNKNSFWMKDCYPSFNESSCIKTTIYEFAREFFDYKIMAECLADQFTKNKEKREKMSDWKEVPLALEFFISDSLVKLFLLIENVWRKPIFLELTGLKSVMQKESIYEFETEFLLVKLSKIEQKIEKENDKRIINLLKTRREKMINQISIIERSEDFKHDNNKRDMEKLCDSIFRKQIFAIIIFFMKEIDKECKVLPKELPGLCFLILLNYIIASDGNDKKEPYESEIIMKNVDSIIYNKEENEFLDTIKEHLYNIKRQLYEDCVTVEKNKNIEKQLNKITEKIL